MDSNFTTQLTMSMLFFAPGILLLGGLALVGLLMLLEKTVFSKNDLTAPMPVETKTIEANPAPGAIVEGLKTAVAKDESAAVAKAANGRDAGRGR